MEVEIQILRRRLREEQWLILEFPVQQRVLARQVSERDRKADWYVGDELGRQTSKHVKLSGSSIVISPTK